MVLSVEPDVHSWEKLTELTVFVCPCKNRTSVPSIVDHSPTDLSWEPDARMLPPGEKLSDITLFSCPFKVFKLLPSTMLHSRMVRSIDPEAKQVASGEKVTANTAPRWPVSLFIDRAVNVLDSLVCGVCIGDYPEQYTKLRQLRRMKLYFRREKIPVHSLAPLELICLSRSGRQACTDKVQM